MRRLLAFGLVVTLVLGAMSLGMLGIMGCTPKPSADDGGGSPVATTPPPGPAPQPQPQPQQPPAQTPSKPDPAPPSGKETEPPKPEYAWVLVETSAWGNSASGAPSGDWSPERISRVVDELFMYHELAGPQDFVRYYARVDEHSIEYQAKKWQGEPPGTVHVVYTWTAPPSLIEDREVVAITLSQEIRSNFTAHYYLSRLLGCEARIDTRDLVAGHVNYFQGTLPDGAQAQTGGRGALSPKFEHESYKQEVSAIELSRAFGDQYRAARVGDKRTIEVKIIAYHQVGVRYTYEYKKVD